MDPSATRSVLPGGAGDGPRRFHLLVLQGEVSTIFPLPSMGALTVGRGDEADVRLHDASISRRQARLLVADGVVRISDQGSRNGTRINGERLEGARELLPGDVVTFGSVVMVLHERPAEGGELGAAGATIQVVVDRAIDEQRTLSAVGVLLSQPVREPAQVVAAIGRHLPRAELLQWFGPQLVVVLIPGRLERGAEKGIDRLLVELLGAGVAARAGIATCPTDACDAEGLVAAARRGAESAVVGRVAGAGDVSTTIRLPERTVLVADPGMARLFHLVKRLAASHLPVLIAGETGTGKDAVAYATHHWSPRSSKPFVVLNCAAIPEALVESELFGYERGAFSGAQGAKPGLLETARGGTVFLDELGELPLPAQAKLLRAMEAKRITRLGDVNEREVDLRIVAATNRDLAVEVKAGRFREDLFFRLSAAIVAIPPLRTRTREIPVMARAFLDEACTRLERSAMQLADDALDALRAYGWPGNVRELKNLIDFLAASVTGAVIEARHLPASVLGVRAVEAATEPDPATQPAIADGTQNFRPLAEEMRELERRRMVEALAAAGGVRVRAARLIGMPLRTFVLKLKQHGLGGREPTSRS